MAQLTWINDFNNDVRFIWISTCKNLPAAPHRVRASKWPNAQKRKRWKRVSLNFVHLSSRLWENKLIFAFASAAFTLPLTDLSACYALEHFFPRCLVCVCVCAGEACWCGKNCFPYLDVCLGCVISSISVASTSTVAEPCVPSPAVQPSERSANESGKSHGRILKSSE